MLEEEGNEAREEAQEEQEEGEYVESVGTGDSAGLPTHLRAARAGLGDPVFFLLTFVAVTVRPVYLCHQVSDSIRVLERLILFVALYFCVAQTSVAFTSMVAVAIPTMLVSLTTMQLVLLLRSFFYHVITLDLEFVCGKATLTP